MEVVCIGAGPASLYTAILLKKAHPAASIRLYEQNRPDDTFGWGVVFSDETLGGFEEADPESFAEIRKQFVYWTDIDNFYPDEHGTEQCVRSTGHGFCGLARKRLLQILHARCEELGIELHFEHEISDLTPFLEADLVVAGDGINSNIRNTYEDHFQPSLDWRKCKFTWLGTTKPFDAFTFIFRANEDGLFRVHAYPFEDGLSTFIVECREETWKRAGLDEATEEDTVAYVRKLFADHLEGHELLTNRSIWRTFPTVRNKTWVHDNIVLMGDAAHTAHFSIGSGTKLAMEDAMALVDAFKEHGYDDVPKVLAAYEAAHRDDTERLQHAAQTSLEWFENTERYDKQSPLQFMFNLMTRSKRITYDNLALRDPDLVDAVTDEFAARNGLTWAEDRYPPPPALVPYAVRDVTLNNRLVVSAMCQYSAEDGVPNDWHFVHYGSFATGGAALVMTEMTCVSSEGRITHGCTGLWNEAQEEAWKRIVGFMHGNGSSLVGLQVGHAGRKGSCTLPWQGDRPLKDGTAWETIAPSAVAFRDGEALPRAMTREDMDTVKNEFVATVERGIAVGFDVIELHLAHGYLLSSFISPLANQRDDEYGGSLENRMRYPLEVLRAVRGVMPEGMPLFARISASDWLDDEGGLTEKDAVEVSRMLHAEGADVIDVSSAYVTPESEPVYGRMYQVPFADRIRHATGIPVMAVGGIQGIDHANTIVGAGRADLCAIARAHLLNPHLTLEGIARYRDSTQPFPKQYGPARPPPRER